MSASLRLHIKQTSDERISIEQDKFEQTAQTIFEYEGEEGRISTASANLAIYQSNQVSETVAANDECTTVVDRYFLYDLSCDDEGLFGIGCYNDKV